MCVPAEERLADPVAAAACAVEVRVGCRGDAVQEGATVVAGMTVTVPLVQHPRLNMCIKQGLHLFLYNHGLHNWEGQKMTWLPRDEV